MKILIVAPSWVGDMMMSHVLFQLVHRQNPGCELHVLAPAWSEALLSRFPEVKKSIVLPFGHGELKLLARYRFAKQLRDEQYDQAIVLPNSLKSALIPYWANIPKRTGFRGEQRYGLLNDMRLLDKKALPQMVQRFAALAFSRDTFLPANLPVPQLMVSQESVYKTLQKYALTQSTQPILVLCPGAEFGSAKRWPAKHFAAVANQQLSAGWAVWILGSPNDAAVAQEIQNSTDGKCVNFTGKTTLSEAIDLLSLSKAVVANDSGLMHIAAALGCFVVAMYGSTSPEFAPPLTAQAKILKRSLPCQPCRKRECPLKHHACMETLLPERVITTLSHL